MQYSTSYNVVFVRYNSALYSVVNLFSVPILKEKKKTHDFRNTRSAGEGGAWNEYQKTRVVTHRVSAERMERFT